MDDAKNVAGIRFSFNALSMMTDEFSEDNIISKTDHFSLFRGKISAQFDATEDEQVTVKILHSSDKLARFREEIRILSHPKLIDCPNIAKLMGYCCEGQNVATVYKLHSVDTLENLLDKDEFQWRDRMIAALGIARIFLLIDLQRTSHLILANLPCYIIVAQGSDLVLCDVQVLAGGIMLLDEGAEDSSMRNDTSFNSEDLTAGKMKTNSIFALGVLLLRLIRSTREVYKDGETQLRSQPFFYRCDYGTVSRLAHECRRDENYPTVSQVVQQLENLLLFSLPVRISSGKVVVGGRNLVYFTYSDLCDLTDKFSLENLFARTQFGEAYRGRIQPGWKEAGAQDIIVKIWGKVNFTRYTRVGITTLLEDDICRMRDEVYLLTQRWMIDNPNVVKLLGYCFEGNKLGAVYSVRPLYTLENLFDDEWLKWKDRIVAAMELARTLVYFHGQGYVLCNITGAHIMIDQDKKPILYDFSMLHGQVLSGRRAARNLERITTIEYLDPYLFQTNVVVPHSDIFAFGALLLSLLCKRDMCPVIKSFVYRHIEARYKSKSSLVDDCFLTHPSFDHDDGRKLTALAMACLGQDCVLSRPSASDIIGKFQTLSLFSSDSPSSNDVVDNVVKAKVIGWQKYVRLFRRLSVTHSKNKERKGKKFSGESGHSQFVSSYEWDKLYSTIQGPKIMRPYLNPEKEQLFDKSEEEDIKKYERLRESDRKQVKFRQSAFVKGLVAI